MPRARASELLLILPFLSMLSQPVAAQTTDSATSIAAAITHLREREYDKAARILEAITTREPGNARAWALLGSVFQSAGELDRALVAHLKAVKFDQTAPNAMYNAGVVFALKGDKHQAFEWLGKAKASGRVDVTQIGIDPDAETLRDDPRYKQLFPTPAEFEDPFVEDVEIIQEWRGEALGDEFGWIARNIGDVDGDDVNDVTTSAPSASANGGDRSGKVYVFSGRTGKMLWKRAGEPGNRLGLGVEGAGDVDADGTPDVIAGAPGAGKAYIFSGRNGVTLLTLDAEDPGDLFGRKVSDLGDVNRDGHDDVIVGAPGNDGAGDGAGRAYVYSGRDGSILLALDGEKAGDAFGSSAAGYVAEGRTIVVVGAPNAGPGNKGRTYVYSELRSTPAFVVDSDETGANLGGMFVSVVGDVNGDRIPDIYASDWSNSALGQMTGRIYVHSGADGIRVLTLTGEAGGDGFGIGPADAGDVDGDGYDDLIIGAWRYGGAAPAGGKVYLFSGRDASLLDTYTGKVPGETLGFDATGVGDVNGDGAIDFLLTSAWSAINGTRSGRMYIVSGRKVAQR